MEDTRSSETPSSGGTCQRYCHPEEQCAKCKNHLDTKWIYVLKTGLRYHHHCFESFYKMEEKS